MAGASAPSFAVPWPQPVARSSDPDLGDKQDAPIEAEVIHRHGPSRSVEALAVALREEVDRQPIRSAPCDASNDRATHGREFRMQPVGN